MIQKFYQNKSTEVLKGILNIKDIDYAKKTALVCVLFSVYIIFTDALIYKRHFNVVAVWILYFISYFIVLENK